MSGPSQWIIMKIIWWPLDCKDWLKTYSHASMNSNKNRSCSGRAKAPDYGGAASKSGILWCRKSSKWIENIKCMKTTITAEYAAFSSKLWGLWYWRRNKSWKSWLLEGHGTWRSECFSKVSCRACSIRADAISKSAVNFRRTAECFLNYVLRWSKIWVDCRGKR